jgi:hypothetical protein
LLALLAAPACSVFESGGLGNVDAGATPAPAVKTGGAPLPQAGTKSLAVWLSAGGGAAMGPNGTIGVSLSCPAAASTLVTSGEARVTLGHFVDTLQ